MQKFVLDPPHIRLQKLQEISFDDLIEALKNDESDIVRHEAAFIIGSKNLSAGILPLINALQSDHSILVRHEAALALSKFPCQDSISALCNSLMFDQVPEVRTSVQYAIGEMLLPK